MNRSPRIGLPTVTKRDASPRRPSPYERAVKPAIDLTTGLLLSVLAFPIIFLTALVSAVTFGGIGIERLERVGKGGKPFTLYRIRTSQLRTTDLRGRRRRVSDVIRRWSLNELPQLWNVALGRMSLVGPRPMSPDLVAGLDEWQRQRHGIKPGLTGLWQVEAGGGGRDLLDNLHYDIQYIDQLSFLTDLRIVGRTMGVWAARREGGPPDSRKRPRPRHGVNHVRLVTTDLVLWPIALTAGVYARFDFSFDTVNWGRMMAVWVGTMAAQLVWGYGVGLYRGRWRLGSFEEVTLVSGGTALITGALLAISTFATPLMARGAIAAGAAFYVLGALSTRYAARSSYIRQARSVHQRTHRMIVFGAGQAGLEAVEALQKDPTSVIEPVAFVDDDSAKRGLHYFGVPVIGGRDNLAEAAWRYNAASLLVAIPSAPPDQIEELRHLGAAAGLQVEVLPPLSRSLAGLLLEHARSAPVARPVDGAPVVVSPPPIGAREPRTREYDLAVIGLGYVGLPGVVEAAKAGLRVLGLDVDTGKIDSLTAGVSYIEDISDEAVAAALAGGFVPTTDPALLARADVITISVPTPLRDGLPDLNAVIRASEAVGDHLNPGQTVVLESTTYPGTTDEVVRPVLEARSGLTAGVDFYLAYSPERIDPGNPNWGVHNTPKLVGGFDQASAERAAQLYGKFAPVVMMSGTRETEMAKLLENTYRHVNIALINEMAVFCDLLGVDIWETIRGAATKPFGFQAFYPGPGVGGHCIPIDPSYLSYRVRQLGSQFQMIELAQEINEYMPAYVAKRATDMLVASGVAPVGARVLILGVAYKPDVSDVRETPATGVVRALRSAGVRVAFADPHVPEFAVDGQPVERIDDPVVGAGGSDLVLIHTSHAGFDLDQIAEAAALLLDTRGVSTSSKAERL